MADKGWYADFPAQQFRVIRPTRKFDKVVDFYTRGLGMKEVEGYSFQSENGESGVMVGMPGIAYHIEIITQPDNPPAEYPDKNNMYVFYFANEEAMQPVVQRMEHEGYQSVPTVNPYWTENGGVSFEDPDGWTVVLFPTLVQDAQTSPRT